MPKNKMKPDFRMEKKTDDQGVESYELSIYDDIGPDWAGMIGAKTIKQALKGVSADAPLFVRINSIGGDCFEGAAIYNQLVRHKGKVTVDIDGAAISAASIIAMAGDEVRIAKNAVLMIHNAWTFAIGNAAELREQADVLDKISTSLASAYSRTGKDEDEIAEMMAATTWMNADEAVEHGFADAVTPVKGKAAIELPEDEDLEEEDDEDEAEEGDAVAEGEDLEEEEDDEEDGSSMSLYKRRFAASARRRGFRAKQKRTPGLRDWLSQAGIRPAAAPKPGDRTVPDNKPDNRKEMKAFLDAFPKDPQFAAEQFIAGKSLDEAKATHDQIAKATALKDAEIARLQEENTQLKAAAGEQGAIATGARADEQEQDPSKIEDPKARAEAEWKMNLDDCHSKFSTKDRYVAIRNAELTGRHNGRRVA